MDRILATHTGSLIRPPELLAFLAAKERGKTFERRADADAFRDSTAADVRRGRYIDPDSGKETLRAFAGKWLACRGAG